MICSGLSIFHQDYISEKATSMWHASGTVKMGKPDDIMACVGTDFKIRGLEGIRVADTSIVPFLPRQKSRPNLLFSPCLAFPIRRRQVPSELAASKTDTDIFL